MKRNFTFFIFVVLILLLAGCSKETIECQTAADCVSNGPCSDAVCNSQGKCLQQTKENCCGNLVCEEGFGENVCGCEVDCTFSKTTSGKCEGKIQVPYPNAPQRTYDATYTQYYCETDGCVAGVPAQNIQEVQLFSNHPGTIELDMVSSISKPYVIGKGNFKIKISLVDINEQFAKGPVVFTKVQIISGNELLAEQQINNQLNDVGDTFETTLVLSPALRSLEEDKLLQVKISYEYFNYNAYDDSTNLQRTSLQTNYQAIPFVDPVKA